MPAKTRIPKRKTALLNFITPAPIEILKAFEASFDPMAKAIRRLVKSASSVITDFI
jgi:hypothetical protein